MGHARIQVTVGAYNHLVPGGNLSQRTARDSDLRPRRNRDATEDVPRFAIAGAKSFVFTDAAGEPAGNRSCLASPKGAANVTMRGNRARTPSTECEGRAPDDATAHSVLAKRELVSRGGIEPPTRRLRVHGRMSTSVRRLGFLGLSSG